MNRSSPDLFGLMDATVNAEGAGAGAAGAWPKSPHGINRPSAQEIRAIAYNDGRLKPRVHGRE
jgi:hypothetical protein